MSNNLEKIQKAIADVRARLESLKPSSGLDDLDAIAEERSTLREKLDLLADAETAERERIEAEEAAERATQRRAFLHSVAEKAEAAATHYQELTDRADSLVTELVETLGKRERALNREAVGLQTPGILSNDEHGDLIAQLDSSAVGVYPGNFGNTWKKAVIQTCGDDAQLRRRLLDLVTSPGNHQDKPLSGARPILAEGARTLAASNPTRQSKTDTVTPIPVKASGHRYEVDLRGPGRVTDLNAD